MSGGGRTPPRPRRRRLALFLVGAAAWTALSYYPNPLVLLRSFQRYRRLPVDPRLEENMGWQLSSRPDDIELFVDSLLVPTADWRIYRVPWYVPAAAEAAQSLHGDCEAKAIVLASLLAGKGIPYEFRASFNHLWVDYPGRVARPGESDDIAYLRGEPGDLRLRWPERVAWREFFAVQREQLWTAMPPVRKAVWLTGLLWIGLAALLVGGRRLAGEFRSRAPVRTREYASLAAWSALAALAAIVLLPAFLPRAGPVRWTLADLREVLALSLLLGAFVAWLRILRPSRSAAISETADSLIAASSFGPWHSEMQYAADDVDHIEMEASRGWLRPATVSAALRTGERRTLVHYRDETSARQALRRFGLAFGKPLVVRSDGNSYWTMSDEIELSLSERMARRPAARLHEKPKRCPLEVRQTGARWRLGYPTSDQRPGLALLGFAAIPVMLLALSTQAVLRFPRHVVVWVVWMVAAAVLSVTIYLAVLLRNELIAALRGAHLEIADGELRFHTPEGKEKPLALVRVQSIELARQGEAATIAIIAAHRIVHLRGFCPAEHRKWVVETIKGAIAEVDRGEARPGAGPPDTA